MFPLMQKNKSLIIILSLCALMLLYISYSLFWQREKNREHAEILHQRIVIPLQEIKDSYHAEKSE